MKQEKGTIYFTKTKTKGKIKIRGQVSKVTNHVARNKAPYQIITLTTVDGEIKLNYFGDRTVIEGYIISGNGMYYNDNCKSLKNYRTLKGGNGNGK
jgi:hypothetical protein